MVWRLETTGLIYLQSPFSLLFLLLLMNSGLHLRIIWSFICNGGNYFLFFWIIFVLCVSVCRQHTLKGNWYIFLHRNHCESSMSILITEFFVLLKTTIVALILIASWGTDSHIYFSKVLSSWNFLIDLVWNAFMCNGLALTIYVNILFGFLEGLSHWSSYPGYLCRQSLGDPAFSLFHYSWGLWMCRVCYLFYVVLQIRAKQ